MSIPLWNSGNLVALQIEVLEMRERGLSGELKDAPWHCCQLVVAEVEACEVGHGWKLWHFRYLHSIL